MNPDQHFFFKRENEVLKKVSKIAAHSVHIKSNTGLQRSTLNVIITSLIFDALHPSQQFFSQVGTISCLPGSNQC